MFKKILVVLFILLSLKISAFANTEKIVNITYVTAPFNLPLIVMKEKGYLDEELKKHNAKANFLIITSGAKQTQAMATGSVDIASVLGSSSAILAKANGAPIEIIGAFSRGPKAYKIMSMDKNIINIKQLKGKKIAGPKGTVLNQLLVAALAKEDLTINDIEYINMDIPAATSALLSGKIDAATIAGSHSIEAQKSGAYSIYDGEGLINPTTVIAARKAWIDDNPDLVDAYFIAHLKAIEFIDKNKDEAVLIAAKEQKISLDEANDQMKIYNFDPELKEKDIINMNEEQLFMIKNNMLKQSNIIDIKNDLVSKKALTEFTEK